MYYLGSPLSSVFTTEDTCKTSKLLPGTQQHAEYFMLTLQQEVIEFFSLKLVINSKKTQTAQPKKTPNNHPKNQGRIFCNICGQFFER